MYSHFGCKDTKKTENFYSIAFFLCFRLHFGYNVVFNIFRHVRPIPFFITFASPFPADDNDWT